jgi:hypothetical protein
VTWQRKSPKEQYGALKVLEWILTEDYLNGNKDNLGRISST